MDADSIRKVNMIEVLTEEALADGRSVIEPPLTWTEEQIRAHFQWPEPPCSLGPASHEDFKKWFPGLALSGTACANPRWRVLCFPNAGNAEDMYTSEGTGARRMPSPLLEWCRANRAECLAVQPPGRNLRTREPAITTCQAMAAALLPIVASKLADAPYIVIAHSVGTWNAFEFLALARAQGLPMPQQAFLSAMPAPDIHPQQRPWRQQRTLPEEDFMEECRGWDVNEVVFSPGLWGTYHALMRADFTQFDEYAFTHEGEAPFDFPVTAFFGMRDRRITEQMVLGWQRFTTGEFECLGIGGHHLWPLDKDAKVVWLRLIAKRLQNLL